MPHPTMLLPLPVYLAPYDETYVRDRLPNILISRGMRLRAVERLDFVTDPAALQDAFDADTDHAVHQPGCHCREVLEHMVEGLVLGAVHGVPIAGVVVAVVDAARAGRDC
jgi:hypothetical protein